MSAGRQPGPKSVSSQAKKDKRVIPEYRRNPESLVREFFSEPKKCREAFDLRISVERELGAGVWDKLTENQRQAVAQSFERAVRELLEQWDPDEGEMVRIIHRDTNALESVLTVLRGEELIRFRLLARNGIWHIAECESVDDMVEVLSDSIRLVLRPGTQRGHVYDLTTGEALVYLDRLIAAEGEKPESLLLKAEFLAQQAEDEELALALKREQAEGKAQAEPATGQAAPSGLDRAIEILNQVVTKWPEFAPGHLALARMLQRGAGPEENLVGYARDTELALNSYQGYLSLMPFDPRPWREMADIYEILDRIGDAEKCYREAIRLDPLYPDHRAAFITFALRNQDMDKANVGLLELLRATPIAEDAFNALRLEFSEMGSPPEESRLLEIILQSFPLEVEKSRSAQLLLAETQEAQNRTGDAIRTMQRIVTREPEADDFRYLSQLYRKQQRFAEALNAANQALKSDPQLTLAHFERACSLAQLGRKREALAALKMLIGTEWEAFVDFDEPDLGTLSILPEFKALKEKMRNSADENDNPPKMKPVRP